jgi:hypothetical protein
MEKEAFRLGILKKVETGEISLETASRLLGEVEKITDEDPGEKLSEGILPESRQEEPLIIDRQTKPAWGALFWITTLMIGAIITALSANGLFRTLETRGMNFWFWFSFLPLGIGIFLIYFAWILERSRWIHIKIHQPEGRQPRWIVFGFPLPIKFVLKVLRIFKFNVHGKLSSQEIEEMLETLNQQLSMEDPISIHVNDKDGSAVEVFMG